MLRRGSQLLSLRPNIYLILHDNNCVSAEAYLDPSRTPTMEIFAKRVNG